MIDTCDFKFETGNYLSIEDSTELDSPGSNTLSWFLLYIVGLAFTIAIVATMNRRRRIPEIRDMVARTVEFFSLGCVTEQSREVAWLADVWTGTTRSKD